jgi:hypothetical protein
METLKRALIGHPNPKVRSWAERSQHVTEVTQPTVGMLLQVSPPGDFPRRR